MFSQGFCCRCLKKYRRVKFCADGGFDHGKGSNFGSLNLDYVYNVDHFVRAGETISSSLLNTFCGGKGLNQSIALARAGAKVYHAGAVGNDGGALVKVLEDNNVDTSLIRIVDLPTGHAIIQRDPDGQNCILLFGGANQSITDSHIEAALSGFSKDDYLILQNEINNTKSIMKRAKDKGMKIVLNPSPMDEKIHALPLELVDIFIVNEVEAESLFGSPEPNQIMKTSGCVFPSCNRIDNGENGRISIGPSLSSPLYHGYTMCR